MGDFLKRETIINLMTSILFLLVGIMLVKNPTTTLSLVAYTIELLLIISGIATIINYVRVESKYDLFSFGFIQGVVCILIAVFLVVNPKIIAVILPITIGIWMVFGSLSKMQVTIKLNAFGQKASMGYILLSGLMFALGFIIICNPFGTAVLIVQMLGIGIVIYSAFDIIQSIGVIRFLDKMDI